MLLSPSVQMALSFTNITGFSSCYIGDTKCHLNTKIEEHKKGKDKIKKIRKDKKSQIYSNLEENPQCQEKGMS